MSIDVDERGLLATCSQCGQRNRLRWQGLGKAFRCPKCQRELASPEKAIDIPSPGVFEEMIRHSSLPVLVDFWAPWCGPCKMVAPEFDKIAAEGRGRWLVGKVNTEELQALAARFRITAIPTMILFRQGREIARQQGAMPAARIRQFIEQAAT